MYQQDYILRQIELMANFIYKLLYGKDLISLTDEEYEVNGRTTDKLLPETLRQMAQQGNINDAEDLLFEQLETHHTADDIAAAVEFYRLLAHFDDQLLEEADYTRAEIVEGLHEICNLYVQSGTSLSLFE